MVNSLSWDDSYAIARLLSEVHSNVVMEEISLEEIFRWTIELTDFSDDPNLANDDILLAIFQEWFEEVDSV